METVTITTIMTALVAIFTSVIGMVGTVVTTITGSPLLLTFALIGLVGIGVGLFHRLIHG